VVAEHAAEHGVGIGDEMALMVVHGLLHLLGYDHQVDADAERMEARERRYLEAVGMVRR
jgi:probable rRNA maturation factor